MKNFYHFAFTVLETYARVKLQRAERRVEDLSIVVNTIHNINLSLHSCPICTQQNEEDPAVH